METTQLKEASPSLAPFSDDITNFTSHLNAVKGKDQPLSESSRAFFEPRFGQDFSNVRVHTGGKANHLARRINAKAFTQGNDIVFNTGQYQPQSSEGKRLIAHELTHVSQQTANAPTLQRNLTDEQKKENLKSPRFKDNQRLQKAYDNDPVMLIGRDWGDDSVKILQQALIDILCPSEIASSPGGKEKCAKLIMPISTKQGTEEPDGFFGAETDATVRKFQSKYSLTPDGRPGRNTLGRLDDLFPAPVPPITIPKKPHKFVCGPDVTNAISVVLDKVKQKFAALSTSEKVQNCGELGNPIGGSGGGFTAWDIVELHQAARGIWPVAYRPECASKGAKPVCGTTVQVGNECFYMGSPNYVLFGAIMKQCSNHFKGSDPEIRALFSELSMLMAIYAYKGPSPISGDKGNWKSSMQWGKAGYHGWPNGGTSPKGDRSHCAPVCPTALIGSGFEAFWAPNIEVKT